MTKIELEMVVTAHTYSDFSTKAIMTAVDAYTEASNGAKPIVSGWQEFGKLNPKIGDEVVVMDKRNGRKQVWNIKDEDFDEEWLKNYCWHLPPA